VFRLGVVYSIRWYAKVQEANVWIDNAKYATRGIARIGLKTDGFPDTEVQVQHAVGQDPPDFDESCDACL
jgi:hypothetical protein